MIVPTNKDTFENIAALPPVNWQSYFEIGAYRSYLQYQHDGAFRNKPIYLLTGLSDRLIALNRLFVLARRRNLTLGIRWLVSEFFPHACPEDLAEALSPHLVIENDDTFPGARWYSDEWPRAGKLAALTDLFLSGRVCFGQPMEKSPLSLDQDVLPFLELVRNALEIHRDEGVFAIHLRGEEFSRLENKWDFVVPVESLKAAAKGRRIEVFSDDQRIAAQYCQVLADNGIAHVNRSAGTASESRDRAIADFREIASSGAVFAARAHMGKYASYAACVGGVSEGYMLNERNVMVDYNPLNLFSYFYLLMRIPDRARYNKLVAYWEKRRQPETT